MFCKHWCQQNWLLFFFSAIIVFNVILCWSINVKLNSLLAFKEARLKSYVHHVPKLRLKQSLSRLFWTISFCWWILKALFDIQFVVLFVYMYKLIEYIIYMLCMHVCMQRFYVNWLLMVSCLFLIHFSKIKLISVWFVFHDFNFLIITLQPHYNTVVYNTNSVITWLRLGSHCSPLLCIRPSL